MSDIATDYQCLHEFIPAAQRALDPNLWDYLVGATETETTLARNRQALDSIAFRPRVLRNVSRIDPSGSFLGRKVRLPVILAPVGGLDSLAENGNIRTGRAAGAFDVPFMLSSVSNTTMEDVAAASPGPKIYQLYVRGDAGFVDERIRRAVDSGYDAFCITVDSAIYSRRERDIARRFAKPWRGDSPGMDYQAAFCWDDLRRVLDTHDVKIILKGIGTGEDAAIACELGVSGIYVSNHGGRQLDHCLGSLDVLPEVVAAVAGRAAVMVDGGISRGSDVVKALALGADMVGVGRLYCYALAAAGEAGIGRALELLETEIIECLGLLGVTGHSGLTRAHVCPARPLAMPHVHSAFPLIDLPRGSY